MSAKKASRIAGFLCELAGPLPFWIPPAQARASLRLKLSPGRLRRSAEKGIQGE